MLSQIATFMGPTWGPSGSSWPLMGPFWPHEPCYQGCSLGIKGVTHRSIVEPHRQTIYGPGMTSCTELYRGRTIYGSWSRREMCQWGALTCIIILCHRKAVLAQEFHVSYMGYRTEIYKRNRTLQIDLTNIFLWKQPLTLFLYSNFYFQSRPLNLILILLRIKLCSCCFFMFCSCIFAGIVSVMKMF